MLVLAAPELAGVAIRAEATRPGDVNLRIGRQAQKMANGIAADRPFGKRESFHVKQNARPDRANRPTMFHVKQRAPGRVAKNQPGDGGANFATSLRDGIDHEPR